MNNIGTLLIVLAVLALLGGIIYLSMSGGFKYDTDMSGGKKHMKHHFFHHNKINLVLALISAYIVYSIFIKY